MVSKSRAIRRWWWLLLIVLLFPIGRQVQKWWDSRDHGVRGPYLQMPAPDGVSIHWRGEAVVAGEVRYGSSADDLSTVVMESTASQRHRIRLDGLDAGAAYYYQLVNPLDDQSSSSSPIHQFHTPPAANVSAPVRLWVLGDPGMDNTLAQTVRRTAQQWLVDHARAGLPLLDVWLTTGDNAYTSGRLREYHEALFQPYSEWLARFPIWPVYGNHDARRKAFFHLFEFPRLGESGGLASASEHYYSFDYGATLHVVILDSQDSDLSASGPMMAWLKENLARRNATWTLALFHHAPYSKGSHDSDDDGGSDWRMRAMREVFLPVLEAHGVDLVLSGHSHAYERSHLLTGYTGLSTDFGREYIVDDGGGKSYYRRLADCKSHCGTVYLVAGHSAEVRPGTLDHPALPIGLAQGGSLIMDIDGGCLNGRMLTGDGLVVDQFIIEKTDARSHMDSGRTGSCH